MKKLITAIIFSALSTIAIANDGQVNESQLVEHGSYTNSQGKEVHSPAHAKKENSIPTGASARCGDGTYSFSQHRRGTCSHHGGVSEWL